MRSLILLAALLAGCDDFPAVQKADTIEAYEAWLTENPESKKRLLAELRLEELYLEKAEAERSLEAYDAYLARFPEGTQRERALAEREDMLWEWAVATNTVEAYEKYIAEYPRGNKEHRAAAHRAVGVLGYIEQIKLGEVTTARVNMAEDPKGELNGWAIRVKVTNNGTSKVKKLVIQTTYVVPDKASPVTKEWPLVAPTWTLPLPDKTRRTFTPGETREWEWTTADLPPEWDGAATVKITAIELDEPR